MKSKQLHLNKKNIILSVIGVIVLILIGWWAFINFTPRPLGDKLEYLGKDSYGCWYCDARPTSVYYYATDMGPSELAAYFKKASLDESEKGKLNNLDQEAVPRGFFYLKTPDGKSFYIEYTSDDQKTPEERGLKKSTKKFVVSILENDYEDAKRSL